MNGPTTVFILALCAAAVALLALLPAAPLLEITGHDAAGAVCFIAVALLAERMAIDFGKGRQARSSIAFVPLLACAVYFDPIVTLGIVAIVITVSNFALRKQTLMKGSFNVAQVVLAVGGAGIVYRWIAAPAAGTGINVIAFAVLALVFFGTNIVLTTIAISLLRRDSFFTVLAHVVGPRGSNLLYDLLASPIAAITAVLFSDYGIPGIIIVILPLILIRYSYLSKLQLEEANRDLLTALIKAIETRDPYTSGHSVRVSTLAKAIARDLSLSPRRTAHAETAALLHDIGKIDSVYSDVIRKPYDLNSAERSLIQTHATKGAELLESLNSVNAEVIAAVRYHHERYDGTGYPNGLKGTTIPLAARIIMVCDSIDAMLSDRPYRRALTIGQVHQELLRCSGSQFDPGIVEVIIARNTLKRAAGLVDADGVNAKPQLVLAGP
jgi:putative nucleotidyltransferase with HDIG domain